MILRSKGHIKEEVKLALLTIYWLLTITPGYMIGLGADTTNVRREDAGRVLSDTLRQFMYDLGIEDDLEALGYTTQTSRPSCREQYRSVVTTVSSCPALSLSLDTWWCIK